MARSQSERREKFANPLRVHILGPVDISNATAWLVDDEACNIAGIILPVEVRFAAK
jgi:hypothetical protein